MPTHSALILLIIILHATRHWWWSFCKLLRQRHETDYWSSYEGVTQQQSPFSPLACIIFKSGYCHPSLTESEWKRGTEEHRKCAVALCLSFASHSKWRLWLSCSNWTLLQIRGANNGSLWRMGRVAVCAVVSFERNHYAISADSHAKSCDTKNFSLLV